MRRIVTLFGIVLGLGTLAGAARADEVPPPPPAWGVQTRFAVRPPVAPGYRLGDAWRDGNHRRLWRFAGRINAQLDDVLDDIRFDVEQGALRPEVIPAAQAGREEVERDLREAMAKGYITPEDREHLERHIAEIRELRDQYRPVAFPRGGGDDDWR